jgi:hypothetical protein
VPIPHSIDEDESTGYARVPGQVFLGGQRQPVNHLLFVATALWFSALLAPDSSVLMIGQDRTRFLGSLSALAGQN